MAKARELSLDSQLFIYRIKNNQLDEEVLMEISKAIENRRILMPLSLVAELIPCPLRTLERMVQRNADMQIAATTVSRRGNARLYPFWVIFHLYHRAEAERDE